MSATRKVSMTKVKMLRKKNCIETGALKELAAKRDSLVKSGKNLSLKISELLIGLWEFNPEKRAHPEQIAQVLGCNEKQVMNKMTEVRKWVLLRHRLAISNMHSVGYKIATLEESAEEAIKSQQRSFAVEDYATKIHEHSSYNYNDPAFLGTDLGVAMQTSRMLSIVAQSNKALQKRLIDEFKAAYEPVMLAKEAVKKPEFVK